MAKVNLNGKTRTELERLLKDIDAEVARREKQNRKDALKAARAAAAAYGFALEDLLAAPKGRRRGPRGPQPAKFKDPGSGKTWSGMGRPPAWYKSHVDAGKPEAELLIA
ncbi:MAG: H-NS histone family protein [Pseudomonadota bacterium]